MPVVQTDKIPQPVVQLAYALPAAADAARFEGCLERLNADERRRYAAFGSARRRLEWLTGRTLLLALLDQELAAVDGTALVSDADGAPRYRAAAHIHLSLSHSHGLVMAARAAHPVGVDVEPLRPRRLVRAAQEFFAPQEAAHLAAQPEAEALPLFHDYWTLKEAACKASGMPLRQGLQALSFDLAEPASPRFTPAPPTAAGPWQFWLGAWQERWRLAVALRAGPAQLHISGWAEDGGLLPVAVTGLRSFGVR